MQIGRVGCVVLCLRGCVVAREVMMGVRATRSCVGAVRVREHVVSRDFWCVDGVHRRAASAPAACRQQWKWQCAESVWYLERDCHTSLYYAASQYCTPSVTRSILALHAGQSMHLAHALARSKSILLARPTDRRAGESFLRPPVLFSRGKPAPRHEHYPGDGMCARWGVFGRRVHA